jgi:hypothetical protein
MAFVAKLEISLAIILSGYLVSWSSVDVKINHRWEAIASGHVANVATSFPVGEAAVFGFKDKEPAKLGAFKVSANNLKELELSVSDQSPTKGFRSLGRFQPSGATSEFTFPEVTPKFLKVELLSRNDETRPIEIREIVAGPKNVLGASMGGRLMAAQPSMTIQKRLFWIVMAMYIVFSGLTLLMAILFPLTEEKMKVVRLKLDGIRIAKAAAGEPTDEVAEEFVHEHPDRTAKFVKEHPEVIENVEHGESKDAPHDETNRKI